MGRLDKDTADAHRTVEAMLRQAPWIQTERQVSPSKPPCILTEGPFRRPLFPDPTHPRILTQRQVSLIDCLKAIM